MAFQTWFRDSAEFWSLLVWKLLTLSVLYVTILAVFGLTAALPPDGQLFHMFVLFVAAHFAGQTARLCRLPPLSGMLVAGFLYGNITGFQLDPILSATTRSLALIIILIRAGLNLDPQAIRRLSLVCCRLSLLPSIVEALTVALLAWLFFHLNLIWSLMLGFVIGSVSPAVVVPGMVQIQEARMGTEKGIPTLLIASASVDNVFAITGVSVCLSIAFGTPGTSMIVAVVRGPLEALFGIIFGLALGITLWYLPGRRSDDQNENYELHRFTLLVAASLMVWFGTQTLGYKSIGPLAILTGPFVASIGWRQNSTKIKFTKEAMRVSWSIFEHFLFSLIGFSVRVGQLDNALTILYGVICITIGVLVRMATAYLVVYRAGFNHRERLFVAIAWLPKATIQAAMGPVALDMAITAGGSNDQNNIDHGRLVLTIAVLSILMTAPIGAIAIDQTYRHLLISDTTNDDVDGNDDQSSKGCSMEPTEVLAELDMAINVGSIE